jgi:hypothetical protein
MLLSAVDLFRIAGSCPSVLLPRTAAIIAARGFTLDVARICETVEPTNT